MESLWKPPSQHIFSINPLRMRSFFSLCDAVSPEFGKDRRSDMSVDCRSNLVKHMLTNEEPVGVFALPVTLHISVCCVRTKVYIANACRKNEMARFRLLGKKFDFLDVSGRLIELLGFDFPDVLILFSRFCGLVFLLGFFFRFWCC